MAGIDLDVQALGLDVFADIGVELKRQNDRNAMLDLHRRKEAARARVPEDVRQFASVVIPTPTARTAMSFGGPQAGFYWLVRRLILGGTTFKTTAAGTAEVYVTGLGAEAIGTSITGPIVSALALTDLVDQAPTLPDIAFYANRQIILQNGENLLVVFDSGSAGQTYAGALQFENHRTVATETSIID